LTLAALSVAMACWIIRVFGLWPWRFFNYSCRRVYFKRSIRSRYFPGFVHAVALPGFVDEVPAGDFVAVVEVHGEIGFLAAHPEYAAASASVGQGVARLGDEGLHLVDAHAELDLAGEAEAEGFAGLGGGRAAVAGGRGAGRGAAFVMMAAGAAGCLVGAVAGQGKGEQQGEGGVWVDHGVSVFGRAGQGWLWSGADYA